ncbi:TolC family protein [Fusobacterium sp. MFO224]|uniref:TolC family protein n=1 Tax=Fusobacterium sp. MFO224 TaxID=3378070 RepID=UPI0038523CAF
MKKQAILFLIFSNLTFSKSLNLDTMLQDISNNSYEKNIYNIEQEKNKANKKFYKLDNYNGVKGTSETIYYREEEVYKTEGNIIFGDFYINGSKKENEESDLVLGVNKNIKDMLYSENDKNFNNMLLDEKITRLNYFNNLEKKQINLIDLYKEYKDVEFEIKAKENGVKTLKSEEEILKKSFNLGKSPEIDLKSAKINRMNLEIELNTLKRKKYKLQEIFFYDFKIQIKDNTLEQIPKKTNKFKIYLNNIGERKLNILNLEKKKIKENIKYLKYDNKYPDISIGFEHDFGSRDEILKENRIYLKITKDLFYYDNSLENEKFNYQEKQLDIADEVDKNKAEILKIQNEYDSLNKEYEVNKNKAILEKNKYEIKKLEYKLGNTKYLDLMDSFNDYLTYTINAEKSKNDLYAYIYKVIIRGDLNENQ